MNPLLCILVVPFVAGLLCLFSKSRVTWERLNLCAFVLIAGFALCIGLDVAHRGTATALGGFLRADALSAVVICLLGFWLPGMIYELVRASARLLGGNV